MNIGWKQRYASSKNLFSKTLQSYNQKPNLRAYLELFLSLATIIIFGVFAIRPTIITIGKLTNEIKAKEETVSVMDQKIENLKNAQALYNKNIDNINILNIAVPDGPLPQSITRQVEAAAGETSVNLTALSIVGVNLLGATPAQNTQDITTTLSNEKVLTISASAKGSFDSLFVFIKELESLRRPVRLNSIGLSKTESEGNENEITVTLNKIDLPYLENK